MAPVDLLYGAPVEQLPVAAEEFAERKLAAMRDAYALVRQHLRIGANRMKRQYDMRVRPARFRVGAWVLYYNPRRYQGRSPKWQRLFTGPFLITKILDPVNVVLQRSRRARAFVCHIDKLKECLGATPESWLKPTEDVLASVGSDAEGVVADEERDGVEPTDVAADRQNNTVRQAA